MFTPKPKTRKETANQSQIKDKIIRERDRKGREKKKRERSSTLVPGSTKPLGSSLSRKAHKIALEIERTSSRKRGNRFHHFLDVEVFVLVYRHSRVQVVDQRFNCHFVCLLVGGAEEVAHRRCDE